VGIICPVRGVKMKIGQKPDLPLHPPAA
jgi:hypothetical protein